MNLKLAGRSYLWPALCRWVKIQHTCSHHVSNFIYARQKRFFILRKITYKHDRLAIRDTWTRAQPGFLSTRAYDIYKFSLRSCTSCPELWPPLTCRSVSLEDIMWAWRRCLQVCGHLTAALWPLTSSLPLKLDHDDAEFHVNARSLGFVPALKDIT